MVDHVKPIAGTELCAAPHFQFHVAGRLHVLMADGTEFDAGPGDVTALPQGHDAGVLGDEAVVLARLVGGVQLRQGVEPGPWADAAMLSAWRRTSHSVRAR